MFQSLRKNLSDLENATVEIYAEGNYPVKARTPVQMVAMWQNDGTERIKPARFVERAAGRHRNWTGLIFRNVNRFLFSNWDLEQMLNEAGLRISFDINKTVNRIKTGQLKRSFRPRIIQGNKGNYYAK